jgi:hypothetical protein
MTASSDIENALREWIAFCDRIVYPLFFLRRWARRSERRYLPWDF